MAYHMRERNENIAYEEHLAGSSSSTSDSHDSTFSDPDYSRTPRRRNYGASTSRSIPPRRRPVPNTATPSSEAANRSTQAADGEGSSERNAAAVRRRGGRRSSGAARGRRPRSNGNSGQGTSQEPLSVQEEEARPPPPAAPEMTNEDGDHMFIVHYIDGLEKSIIHRGQLVPMGAIPKRKAVLCLCCYGVFEVDEFTQHANNMLQIPCSRRLCFTLRVPLLSCLSWAWQHAEQSVNLTSGSACMICALGEEPSHGLIRCNSCRSTYHPNCMSLQDSEIREWSCPECVCKYCRRRSSESLNTCLLCDRRYHLSCDFGEMFDTGYVELFCSAICFKMHNKLQKMVGVEKELEDGISWTLLPQMPVALVDDTVFRRHKYSYSKTGTAWNLMDYSFLPNIDQPTGPHKLQLVLTQFQSMLARMNCGRFYTVLLEKGDEIISVATIRFCGRKFAEISFAATRPEHRRQRMLHRLVAVIESTLIHLKVENVIIQSPFEVVNIWVQKFGFFPIGDNLMREVINFSTLMYPTAVRLEKSLVARPVDQQAGPSTAAAVPPMEANREDSKDRPKKAARFDTNMEASKEDDDDEVEFYFMGIK